MIDIYYGYINQERKEFMTGKRTNPNNTEPVYLQTYKQILREIQEKRWNPGDKLPADMAFAKELGINHLTLKKALNRLAAEGFLVRTPGRGTFIAEKLPVISGKILYPLYQTLDKFLSSV